MGFRVAVVIVGFRNCADILDCLAALTRSRHFDFEVVICENGGAESCAVLGEALPAQLADGQPVRLICADHNLGYAGGVNTGIAATPDCDGWWVLNPDTLPEAVALEALVERLGRGDCEAVGGVIQLPTGQIQTYGGRWQWLLARAVSLGHGQPVTHQVDPAEIESRQNFLSGASMLVGRHFLQTVGPMREDYFLYCEEVEWCLRGGKAGMRLGFAPKGVVMHKQGGSTGATVDLRTRSKLSVYLNERNRVLLIRDCCTALLPLAVATVLAGLLIRFGKRRAWRQLGYAAQGWLSGVLNRRGVPNWMRAPTKTAERN